MTSANGANGANVGSLEGSQGIGTPAYQDTWIHGAVDWTLVLLLLLACCMCFFEDVLLWSICNTWIWQHPGDLLVWPLKICQIYVCQISVSKGREVLIKGVELETYVVLALNEVGFSLSLSLSLSKMHALRVKKQSITKARGGTR